MIASLYYTKELLKNIFENISKEVINKISSVYNDVDEEVISSVYCTDLKYALLQNIDKIKDAYINDFEYFINNNFSYSISNNLKNIVSSYLLCDLIIHDRKHEGNVSKSDFAFLIELPIFKKTPQVNNGNKIEVIEYVKGILIQAKRRLKKGIYRKISFKSLPYSEIKDFYSLCLYKFEEINDLFKLNEIKFLPIKNNNLSDMEFIDYIENILDEQNFKDEINPGDFINELIHNHDFGTSNKEYLKKFIACEKYDITTFKLHYGDDGDNKINAELKNINDVLNNNMNIVGYV